MFFAITVIFGCLGGGNMFQANQAYVQFVNITGGEDSFLADKGWLFGLVFAVVVGVVIIGGIKSIARVTEKVVPFMAVFYLTGAFVVLFMNAERIPAAIESIFANAFSPEGIGGGFIPNVDGLTGVGLTSEAMQRNIAWFPTPLALAVVLFAFSTMISWSYYGLKGWTYLFGESRAADVSFKLMFCLFVVIGCTIPLASVLDFSDAMIFAMAIPNILGIYLLAPIIKREMNSYFARIKSGEIRNYRKAAAVA